MSFLDRDFIFMQLLCIVAVVVAIVSMPGVDPVTTMAAFIGVWLLVQYAWSQLSARSDLGRKVLLVIWMLMCIGIVANVWHYTTLAGGTTARPVLLNPDMGKLFQRSASYVLEEQDHFFSPQAAFIYGMLMHLTGVSIVPVMVLNMFMVLIALVVVAYVSSRVWPAGSKVSSTTAAWVAMLFYGSISYVLAMGTVLLKESFVILGFSLFIVGLLSLISDSTTKQQKLQWVAYVAGVILMFFGRNQTVWFALLAVVLCVSPRRKGNLVKVAVMAAIPLLIFWLYTLSIEFAIRSQYATVAVPELTVASYLDKYAHHAGYNGFLAKYFFGSGVVVRLLCVPVACVVQYFIPFLWNASISLRYGPTMAFAHCGVQWYMVGGMVIYYLFSWLRVKNFGNPMLRLAIVGAVLWIVPAILTGGVVVRYAVCYVAAMAPAAAYVWLECRHKRGFKIYAAVYSALLIFALCFAFILQKS